MSMWYDGGRIKDIRPVQNRLKKILAIELPKEDFEQVDKEQVGAIEARMGESERALDERMSISNNVLLYFKMTKPGFAGA